MEQDCFQVTGLNNELLMPLFIQVIGLNSELLTSYWIK